MHMLLSPVLLLGMEAVTGQEIIGSAFESAAIYIMHVQIKNIALQLNFHTESSDLSICVWIMGVRLFNCNICDKNMLSECPFTKKVINMCQQP